MGERPVRAAAALNSFASLLRQLYGECMTDVAYIDIRHRGYPHLDLQTRGKALGAGGGGGVHDGGFVPRPIFKLATLGCNAFQQASLSSFSEASSFSVLSSSHPAYLLSTMSCTAIAAFEAHNRGCARAIAVSWTSCSLSSAK